MPGWMNHKLESRLPREISTASDMQTLMAESEEELKSLLTRMKEESEKAGLKLNIQKTKTVVLVPSHHANRWRKNGNNGRFYFLGLHNH